MTDHTRTEKIGGDSNYFCDHPCRAGNRYDSQYFLKIEEDKVKDERKERESLLENFKKLGLKNKRLKDDLKGKGGRPSARVKLMEDSRKELQEAQKEVKEQQKLTSY